MKKWTDFRVPLAHCPTCNHKLDAASNPEDDRPPAPGDATICIKCATVLIYLPDMSLRLATQEEINLCGRDMPQIVRAIKELHKTSDKG